MWPPQSVPLLWGSATERTSVGFGLSAGAMSRATSKRSSPVTTFALSAFSRRSKNVCSTLPRCEKSGFCAGIQHAQFMADQFTEAGCRRRPGRQAPTPQARRDAVARSSVQDKLRAIFTVDIFNEGVDIPEVDTLLLLRPTESATIFLQQLGRGLR